jgi:hypothetical protein
MSDQKSIVARELNKCLSWIQNIQSQNISYPKKLKNDCRPKKKLDIDFINMTQKDIKNLDFTDPELLKFLGIKPLPLLDNLDPVEYRELCTKLTIMLDIIELQRETVFGVIRRETGFNVIK